VLSVFDRRTSQQESNAYQTNTNPTQTNTTPKPTNTNTTIPNRTAS